MSDDRLLGAVVPAATRLQATGTPGPRGPASSGIGIAATVSPTPPANPYVGMMWFDGDGFHIWDQFWLPLVTGEARGLGWAKVAAPVRPWRGVAYGDGRFVAVANFSLDDDRQAMTSPDGINWTLRSIPPVPVPLTPGIWTAVAYGVPNDSTRFVAAGRWISANHPGFAASADGITWTTPVVWTQGSMFSSVAYGNGYFLAVGTVSGASRTPIRRPDGNWNLGAAVAGLQSAAYGNDRFVAVGPGNLAAYGDPTTGAWQALVPPTTIGVANNEWRSIAYGNNTFVAVASSGTSRVMTSPDGAVWTLQTVPLRNWFTITFGGGMFLALDSHGGAGGAMTSPDGVNWTVQDTLDGRWSAITYGAGKFVVVSLDGEVMVST